jgi:hypothetical protein
MQGKITSDLSFCLSDDGFSLDELVVKLSEVYDRKGLADLLTLILLLAQDVLLNRIASGKASGMGCCPDGRLQSNGSYARRIATSLGEVSLPLWRMRCSSCGKSFAPLSRFVRLGRYQTKTGELEKLVVEAVSETSYRRASDALDRVGKVRIPHRTMHGWVAMTGCDEIKLSGKVIGSAPLQVMPDGTAFKGAGQAGKARRGELKVVIGVNAAGEVFPLGSYAGETWEEISGRWRDSEVSLPDGSILVSDGEPGLANAFAGYVDERQRCHWHIIRDLYHAMWRDGGSAKAAKPIQNALAGVLAIELPEADFQQVSESEKDDIEERMEKAESAVGKLIFYLEGKGYGSAADYLRTAKSGMFGYVRRWLKWGLISPRASSMVERVMRELARRIKRIAYGWSDKGVEKIARIIIKRFANQSEWERYWRERMHIKNDIWIALLNLMPSSQDLAH